MSMTTGTASGILTPETVSALLVRPAFAQSVAGQVCRIVYTQSKTFRIPVVSADPNAAWVAEGAEIAPSNLIVDQVVVTPTKVAGLTIISNELHHDTSPQASEVVGEGLARDIARRIDEAMFGPVLAAPAPPGLESLATAGTVTAIDAGEAWVALDAFEEARGAAEQVTARISAWVCNPATALALATLKDSSTSNKALLGADPAQPTRRVIAGVPLFVSPYVAADRVWGIPGDRTLLVVREDAEIDVDTSVFFTSHRVAVRGVMRVGIGYTHPAAIVAITLTPPA